MEPIVSIIIPVYNCEKTIQETVESVIRQSFSNWELILVNDGSTDATREICEKLAESDARIQLINKENGGVSSARNLGLAHAKGEYIEFVDGDDLLVENAVGEILARIGEHGLLIFGYERIPSGEKKLLEVEKEYGSYLELADDYPLFEERNLINSPCNKLYRKRIILENNVQFPLDFSAGEDLLFNLDYIKYCGSIISVPLVLYEYRTNNSQSLSGCFREDGPEIQKSLKHAVDLTFPSSPTVLQYSAYTYAQVTRANINELVYSKERSKADKCRLMEKWLKDPELQESLKMVCEEIPMNSLLHLVFRLMKEQKVHQLYLLVRCRYYLLKIKNHH